MAQNNININPAQTQQLVDSGYLSPETAAAFTPPTPEQTPPPATKQNQQLTQKALDDEAASQAALAQIRNTLASQTKYGTKKSSDSEVAQYLRDQEEENKINAELDAKLTEEETQDQISMLTAKQQKLMQDIATFDSKGLNSSNLQKELNEVQSSLQALQTTEEITNDNEIIETQKTPDLTNPEEVKSLIAAEDALDLQDQTDQKRNQYLDEMSRIQGQMEADELHRQKLIEEQNKIFSDIEDLKKQASNTQVPGIWGGNAGSQIMASIAIALGAYTARMTGSNVNQSLDLVNKMIDREVEQSQQSFKNQLALKSALMDKVKSQLNILDSQTASQVKKANIVNLRNSIEVEQKKLEQQMYQEVRKQKLTQALQRQELSIPQEQAIMGTLDKQQIEQANVLAKEYSQKIKDTGIDEFMEQLESAKGLVKDPTGIGDIALVFMTLKKLDERSTVREGEFKLAEDAKPAVQKLKTLAENIIDGTRLSAPQREQFMKIAEDSIKIKTKRANNINEEYKVRATSLGIPPRAGVGIREFSMNAILPEEYATQALVEKSGKSREQVEKYLKASGKKAIDFLKN